MLISIIILMLCISGKAVLLTAGAAYLIVEVLIRLVLTKARRNEYSKESPQEIERLYLKCILISSILVIASFILLGIGISSFYIAIPPMIFITEIAIIILLSTKLILLSVYWWRIKKEKEMTTRICKFLSTVDLNIILSLIICITMNIHVSEKSKQIIGITGVVFGLAVVLISIFNWWFIFIDNERNNNIYRHFKENRIIIFTKLSLRKDIVVVVGKIILGIMSLSAFMFINALYSAGMGFAKHRAIRGQGRSNRSQIKSYFDIGVGILAASICYVIYSFRMFHKGDSIKYSLVVALIIAMYTFTEFYFIIRDYIRARRSKNLLSEQIKLIGLSSALIGVVLTQTAIMSISYDGDATVYNGISGVLFGSLSVVVGIYMMIRGSYLKKLFEEGSLNDTK